MNVSSVVNTAALKDIERKAQEALVKTADAVKSDLIRSQTMPFDTAALQNRSTFVDDSDVNKGVVRIVSDTPYARRLYFHPEYDFKTDGNPNAGGEWFEPYISGDKKDKAAEAYGRFLKL